MAGRGLALIVLPMLGCAMPLPPPPPAQPGPSFALDDTYYTRVADLRTTLAGAGIAVRTAEFGDAFATADCAHPSELAAFGGCVRCQLAGPHTRVDGSVLEGAARAFARYPTDVLLASQIDHVAMCQDVVYARAGEPQHPAGTVDLRGHGMLINLADFVDQDYRGWEAITIEDIAHHEFFHLLEYAHMHAEMLDDPEWRVHNAIGFEYDAATPQPPAGFVNSYAMTSEGEDRASVYQYLMARPDELCELARTDELLRTKTRIIWRRVAAAVGDRFLRARAGCVDWLDPMTTAAGR